MSTNIQVICDLYFEGDRLPTEVFHAHAFTLMEELHTLDECNDRIADALVSSDAGEAVMTVEMFVAADDPFEASGLTQGSSGPPCTPPAPIRVAGRSPTSLTRREKQRTH